MLTNNINIFPILRLAAGFFFFGLPFFTGLAAAAGFFKTSPSQDFLIRALLPGRGLPSASWLKLILALLGVSGMSSSLVRSLLSGLLAGAGVFFGGFVAGLGIGISAFGRLVLWAAASWSLGGEGMARPLEEASL